MARILAQFLSFDSNKFSMCLTMDRTAFAEVPPMSNEMSAGKPQSIQKHKTS